MIKIYSPMVHWTPDKPIFKLILNDDINNLKKLIKEEKINIYENNKVDDDVTPLHVALALNKQKNAEILLNIYDRDLETLTGTDFKKLLIAFPSDQDEEFYKKVLNQPNSCDFEAILIKNNSDNEAKLWFIQKSDTRLIKKLRTRNGICDLNSRNIYGESFLHIAAYHSMHGITQRLLNHRTIDKKPLTTGGHTPLHYAINSGDLRTNEIISSDPVYKNFTEDESYLYQAALSSKQKNLDVVIRKIMENGKTFEEITKTQFPSFSGDNDDTESLLHVIARNADFLKFLDSYRNKLSENDFRIQNSCGETILHCALLNSHQKTNDVVKTVTKLVEICPKLLLVENRKHQLPLHYAAFFDQNKLRLIHFLEELTVGESKNVEIFYENTQAALETVCKAIEMNNGLSESYWNHFQKLLRDHGPQFLQKTLKVTKRQKPLKAILSTDVKINPNEYFEGTNAFLTLTRINLDAVVPIRDLSVYEKLKILMAYHPIEEINARDECGATIFMYVVGWCQDCELIKKFLSSGVDMATKDGMSRNCLHYASFNTSNQDVVQILLDAGADPSVVSISDSYPIAVAMKQNNCQAFKVLLPFVTREQLEGKFGKLKENLIQCSMYAENVEIAETLVEVYKSNSVQINPNDVNDDGNNLLMINLRQTLGASFNLIFESFYEEIDFDARNKKGEVVSHLLAPCLINNDCSILRRHESIIDILNKQMNIDDNEGNTPFDIIITYCSYNCEAFIDFCLNKIAENNLRHNFTKIPKFLI